jgi:hypothetical protein
VNKGDRMANNNDSVVQRTWKWRKFFFFFFHILNLNILNSCIIVSSCGSKVGLRKFCLVVGNECKGASSSIHPKKKTKPTCQPNETP